jgi:hypothetical protein
MKRGLLVASTKRKRPPMIEETNPGTDTREMKRPKVVEVATKDESRKDVVNSTFHIPEFLKHAEVAKAPEGGPSKNSGQMSVSAYLRQQKLSKGSRQSQPLHMNLFPSLGAGRLKSLQPSHYRHLNTFPSVNESRRSPRWTPLFHKNQIEPTVGVRSMKEILESLAFERRDLTEKK